MVVALVVAVLSGLINGATCWVGLWALFFLKGEELAEILDERLLASNSSASALSLIMSTSVTSII